ncbi:MAG: 6-bladed beta-propeller [Candidatus Delongbacteria bacterium]|jgi:hypothetical protein|nr:6-bladed beta-propeller [Candidatus Delongbacteria bacterium]
MKKYSKILVGLFTFSVLLSLLTVGCSRNETCTITEKDGVKHYQNRNVPANPNLKLVIDNKLEIVGNAEDSLMSFSHASDMEMDDDGNFYILDGASQTIHKYDKTGKYLLNFCRAGNGPGEINGAQDIAIVGDSLTICSPRQARGSVFDLNGNFARNQKIGIPGLYYGVVDIGIGANDILGYHPTFLVEGEQVFIGNELVIKDKKYKTKIVLHEVPATIEPMDIEGAKIVLTPFASYGDNIYYPTKFTSSYTINIKDKKGNLKGVISKHARRIEVNPEEKKHYQESSQFGWNGERIIPDYKLKAVMNKMFTDKYGHLLVWVSQQRKEGFKHNPAIDIFKDGVFQNTIVIDVVKLIEAPIPTDETFHFMEDKLVVYDGIKNAYSIYDYHYEGM